MDERMPSDLFPSHSRFHKTLELEMCMEYTRNYIFPHNLASNLLVIHHRPILVFDNNQVTTF